MGMGMGWGWGWDDLPLQSSFHQPSTLLTYVLSPSRAGPLYPMHLRGSPTNQSHLKQVGEVGGPLHSISCVACRRITRRTTTTRHTTGMETTRISRTDTCSGNCTQSTKTQPLSPGTSSPPASTSHLSSPPSSLSLSLSLSPHKNPLHLQNPNPPKKK